jgi:hypothetical protein
VREGRSGEERTWRGRKTQYIHLILDNPILTAHRLITRLAQHTHPATRGSILATATLLLSRPITASIPYQSLAPDASAVVTIFKKKVNRESPKEICSNFLYVPLLLTRCTPDLLQNFRKEWKLHSSDSKFQTWTVKNIECKDDKDTGKQLLLENTQWR